MYVTLSIKLVAKGKLSRAVVLLDEIRRIRKSLLDRTLGEREKVRCYEDQKGGNMKGYAKKVTQTLLTGVIILLMAGIIYLITVLIRG